jgi:hypothetical protein
MPSAHPSTETTVTHLDSTQAASTTPPGRSRAHSTPSTLVRYASSNGCGITHPPPNTYTYQHALTGNAKNKNKEREREKRTVIQRRGGIDTLKVEGTLVPGDTTDRFVYITRMLGLDECSNRYSAMFPPAERVSTSAAAAATLKKHIK